MYMETNLARLAIEDRLRDADQQRLARQFRRERPSAATPSTSVREPRRHSRLWSLVHSGQAYG
jgi:hypothetical protein